MFFRREKRVGMVAALLAVLLVLVSCTAPTLTEESIATSASPTAALANTPSPAAVAASLDGAWEGTISVAGQELGIQLNIAGLGGTIDIPAQGARGIRIENFSVQGDQVKFEMLPQPQTATFTGTIEGDQMSGAFEQAGFKGEWKATRTGAAAAAPTADPNKGYTEKEVTFKNKQYTLAGTLSMPAGAGPHPAVILISGSGAQNRDEEIYGFKPFAILADALTRQGIAVLRYDDRGIGGSTTGTVDDSSETFAADVAAAFDYLKTRSEIDPARIGLLGHSEGGIIAPMVAVDKGDVAFLVLLAGPGVPGRDFIIEQVAAISKSNGADQATIDETVAEQTRVFDAIQTGKGLDELKAEIIEQMKAVAAELPQAQRDALGDLDAWAEKAAQGQLDALQGAWITFFLAHDPAPVLAQVDAPVLALFGGKDVQVVAAQNEPAVRAALEKGGNQNVTIKTFPDANHLFQSAQTGSPNEYATLAPEFAPGVVETITSWVVEQTK